MNQYLKTLNESLDPEKGYVELVSKSTNKIRGIYNGRVYDSYLDLPHDVRFKIASILRPYYGIYTELAKSYPADEAEERLVWCLFGSFDGSTDINVISGRANMEVSSHCESCQYAKPFCMRSLNYLTKRETQCYRLMRLGMTDKEIGLQLGISYRTVTKHFRNAIEKLRDMTGINCTRQYVIHQMEVAGL